MNKITIELCAEDRARLDSLIVLAARIANGQGELPEVAPDKALPGIELEPEPEQLQLPIEEAPQPEPVKEEKPAVTLAQIQQKVVQLCAGFGGKKKPQVREIISTYGEKVSDLKEQPDKWDEVWNKLTMLEIEEV
jgi:hypothetical protein